MTDNDRDLLDPKLRDEAAGAAEADGVSLSEFVGDAVAEKLRVREFILARTGRSDIPAAFSFARYGGDEPPREGDRIDDGSHGHWRTAAE